MSVLNDILAEARDDNTFWIVGALVVARLLLHWVRRADDSRARWMTRLTALHVLLVPIAGALRSTQGAIYRDVRLPTLVLGAVASVSIAGAVVFAGALPPLRIRPPRILQDVLVAGVSIFVAF